MFGFEGGPCFLTRFDLNDWVLTVQFNQELDIGACLLVTFQGSGGHTVMDIKYLLFYFHISQVFLIVSGRLTTRRESKWLKRRVHNWPVIRFHVVSDGGKLCCFV
jgi:hypothetical protein